MYIKKAIVIQEVFSRSRDQTDEKQIEFQVGHEVRTLSFNGPPLRDIPDKDMKQKSFHQILKTNV